MLDLPALVGQTLFLECFAQAVSTLQRKREIGFRSRTDAHMYGQVVSLAGDDMLIQRVSKFVPGAGLPRIGTREVVAVSVGIVSPIRIGVGVVTVALASVFVPEIGTQVDAALTAGTGGCAVRTGSRDQ